MGKPVQISITSDPARLAEVRITVERISREVGFGEDEVSKLVLAVDEALTNIIRHGYEGQRGLPIELVFEPEPESSRRGLEIRIRDYGRQADLEAADSRSAAVAERPCIIGQGPAAG